jgi:hypothetical protein
MRRSQSIDCPSTIFLVSNQRSNANDRVVDVLREFVAHGRANLVIALAVMAIGGDETSFQVISGVSLAITPTSAIRPVRSRFRPHNATA